MTPYQYLVTLDSEKHLTHVLRIDMNSPDILLREPKNPEYSDIFRSLNDLYPVGAKRPHSRYLGEILLCTDRHQVVALQQQREFRFFQVGQLAELDLPLNVSLSKPSPYTQNIVGYMERPVNGIRVYHHGECIILAAAQSANDRGKEMQERLASRNCFVRLITWLPVFTARIGKPPSWNTSGYPATTIGAAMTSRTRIHPPTSPRACAR